MKMDFIEDFKAAMVRDGLITDSKIISDKKIHRVYILGDSKGSENGWYVLHGDGIPSGAYGSWKEGVAKSWCSKRKDEMSSQDWELNRARIEFANAEQIKIKAEVNANARERANVIWMEAKPANDKYPYLRKKGIMNHGLRINKNGKLTIPLSDSLEEIQSLQFIDEDGGKQFLKGGSIRGNYFLFGKIQNKTDKLGIGEGYATCATIFEVTGYAVACTFNCGNLVAVARILRAKYPDAEIVIFADNDKWPNKDGVINNQGLNKAREAAQAISGKVIFPEFSAFDLTSRPTDFNDLMLLGGQEEVKHQINQFLECDDWPDPKPIKSELLPVQDLQEDLIPEPFRDFVKDVSDRMQCPLDFLVITILNVTASIIGTGCTIKPKAQDNWRVIPNLWGCIIGRPGFLKSPSVAEVIHFLSKLETDAKKNFDEKNFEFNVDLELYKAEKDSIKEAIKKTFANRKNSSQSVTKQIDIGTLKTQLIGLKEPPKPIWRRFKTNDSTIEKLSELLAENPRGLLVYRDELIGLLKNCDKAGHESDRSFFLESWNGDGSQTSDRIARGTVYTENLCLSIFGTTQPDKLTQYLLGALNGDNDGLIQRFQLMVYPDGLRPWECVDRKPNEVARKRVFEIITKLSESNFSEWGAKKDEGNRFPYFSFDEVAQQAFYEWWANLEKTKLLGEDHSIIIEHLSKYRKLMPALALIFYLIDRADGKQIPEITVDYVGMAADFCEYLESHARRIYGLVTDVESQAAAVLSKKILQGRLKDKFSVRDVYRLKGLLKEIKIAQAACEELIDAGWLREIITHPAYQQKGTTTYLINPKIRRGKNG